MSLEGAQASAPLRWRAGETTPAARELADEVAVALVHDATTTAVMLASPSDLLDFGVGFSLSEGIISQPRDLRSLEVVHAEAGIEVRAWLAPIASDRLAGRRRRLAGPTGCGLCGIESLADATRPPPRVGEGLRLPATEIAPAFAALSELQSLGGATRATHAAAWWTADGGITAVREDVGRHNALDKTIGALARVVWPIPEGAVFLTSRVSVELVQKAAVAGAQTLVAVSAPTALAVRQADEAGMTLVAVARDDGFEVFTHPERVVL